MSVPFSIRLSFAKPPRGGDPLLLTADLMTPNETIAQGISLGLQKLAFRAAKERFTGKGPFPVAQHRLGVVSGRLRRDLHSEPATLIADGYKGRMGASVEHFGPHEVGFSGTVNVPQHTRGPYTVKRRKQKRTSKKGKEFSIRANQYSVFPHSVRAHSKKLDIPARRPLATAIKEHGGEILDGEISKSIRTFLRNHKP